MTDSKETQPDAKFTVVVIGDGGVGKTVYCERFITGEFVKKYQASTTMETYTWFNHYLPENLHLIEITIRDVPGKAQNAGLSDGYYVDSDAAIIMFDVTSKLSYKNVATWYKDYKRVCPDAPVVLVGNKVDNQYTARVVKPRDITFHRKRNLQYYEVSAKSCYNYEKPFVHLARKICKEPNLILAKCCCERGTRVYRAILARNKPDAASHPPDQVDAAPGRSDQVDAASSASSVPLPDDDEDL